MDVIKDAGYVKNRLWALINGVIGRVTKILSQIHSKLQIGRNIGRTVTEADKSPGYTHALSLIL